MQTICEVSAPAVTGADVMWLHLEHRTLAAPCAAETGFSYQLLNNGTAPSGRSKTTGALRARYGCTQAQQLLLPGADPPAGTSAARGSLRTPGGFAWGLHSTASSGRHMGTWKEKRSDAVGSRPCAEQLHTKRPPQRGTTTTTTGGAPLAM